jgi:hypothetical protein
LAAVAAKIEDEQSLGIKMQKQVKELSVSFHLGGKNLVFTNKEKAHYGKLV